MTLDNTPADSRRSLWRESSGALPNTLALGYALLGYLAGFWLMAAEAWYATVAGVLLNAHAMVIAAYLVHEAAHYALFASVPHNRIAGEAMSWIAGSAATCRAQRRCSHCAWHCSPRWLRCPRRLCCCTRLPICCF